MSSCWAMPFRHSLISLSFKRSVSIMSFSPSDHKGVIVGKRWFLEPDAVESFLVESDRRVFPLRRHFLVKDILDIVSSIGLVRDCFSQRLKQRGGAILIL